VESHADPGITMTIDVLRSATPETSCEWERAEARVMEDIFLS